MASSEASLPFPFDSFCFFFSLVMLWVEMLELVRLRPFFGGDMGGAGLLRVLGMVVAANGVGVTLVMKRDNITSAVPDTI